MATSSGELRMHLQELRVHLQELKAQLQELRAQLQELEVTEVEETGREFGRGSYGVVKELRVRGHRCAGKKLHETFFSETSEVEQLSATVRFAQECLRHSKLHHPNIVQLIGIHFSPRNRAPTLIMELMHRSLTQALEQYPLMPSHVKNRILLDVTYGLHFLHDRTPPIIHRDLTASNILLSENMRAKIADLGQAKIVSIHPMTKTPGNVIYMPPEALAAGPVYNAKLDMFSFGALIIHMFIHDWPTPKELVQIDPAHPGRPIALTEIKRRAHYLEQMGEGNPLTNMATRCLENDPALRPTAAEVIRELEGIIRSDPPPANIFDMLQELNTKTERIQTLDAEKQALVSDHAAEVEGLNGQIETLERDKQALEVNVTHKETEIDEGQREITRLRQNLRMKDTEIAAQRERIRTREEEVAVKATEVKALSKEVNTKTERIQTLDAEKQALVSDHTTEVEGLNRKIEALERRVESLEGDKRALEVAMTHNEAEINEGQREINRLRENLQTKDTEIAIQRERIRTREEEVAVKTTEVKALSKDATAVVSSDTSRSKMATQVTFKAKNCNVLVLGITGAGRSTICNQIIGEDYFLIVPKTFSSVTMATSHVRRIIPGPENIMYDVKVIDTIGFFNKFLNAQLNDESVLKDIKTYMQHHVPEGVSLVLFVLKGGRLTGDERATFDFIMRFCGISPISALVLTHCDGIRKESHKDIIQDFCRDQRSADAAKFMQKGIYTVGFPDLSTLRPERRSLYEEDMAAEAKTLRNLMFRSTDMLPTKNSFVRTFFRRWGN